MRLVVIGGVAAGLSAAARARRLAPSLDILVLEKGETISYAACGLPYFVEGRVHDWRKLVVYSPDYFRAKRRIEVRTSTEVTGIEHWRRRVRLASGDDVHYDRLVLATGARQDTRAIGGAGSPNVFSLNTLETAVRLRGHLERNRPGHAVIVGGGYIGLEAVEALRTNGWRVTLLHAGDYLLGREDSGLTQRIAEHLHRFRVDVRLNQPVRTVEPGQAGGVACDLVVLATGLRPNVELAAEAGIELGRTGAIRTTDRMETNLGGIWAAGDCAETTHLVTGRPVWLPLGTTANKMGRVAGACAAGARERFPGIVGTSIVRTCGLGVATTGLCLQQARKAGFDPVAASIEAKDRASYFQGRPTVVELVADRPTRRLLGGYVLGEYGVEGRINVLATALHNRMRVDDFEQLDLAYAPPFSPVWDPMQVAAQQLIKLL